MKRTKLLIPILALMFCMGVLFFSIPAYASDGSDVENLTVDSVWLEDEILNIEVTDKRTDINQTLEISLTEYAGNSEYVSVQAVDNEGNKSNTMHFKNPFYTAETNPDDSSTDDSSTDDSSASDKSQSGVPDGSKPLTPDGTGTVMDNVTDGDGKEFFTVTTEDGNEFYMIIDRQRSNDNVYLLNAVTDDDLAALAQKTDGSSSGVPSQQTPETNPNQPPVSPATPEPEPETTVPTDTKSDGTNNGTIIFIAIAAVVVGGVGYYFKILRPKKTSADGAAEEDYEDDYYEDDYNKDGEDE